VSNDRVLSGTFHLTAGGETSWHGFAGAIIAGAAERGMLQRTPQVKAIGSADYPTRAKRPSYSCLDTTKLSNALAAPMLHWTAGLERVMDDLKAESAAFAR
jgi:dTDP-4-dehydrorhamnose reductase